jgi:diphthine-ammonia ligase
MFQSIGSNWLQLLADAFALPLFRQCISGASKDISMDYTQTTGDEVEDLYQLLKAVKDAVPGLQAVASGAILSNYQRTRVEHVCSRLGLVSLAFLWQQDQQVLLDRMIDSGLNAVLVKVASAGLDTSHLGLSLEQVYPHLIAMVSLLIRRKCTESMWQGKAGNLRP